jgi:hypothetical protein
MAGHQIESSTLLIAWRIAVLNVRVCPNGDIELSADAYRKVGSLKVDTVLVVMISTIICPLDIVPIRYLIPFRSGGSSASRGGRKITLKPADSNTFHQASISSAEHVNAIPFFILIHELLCVDFVSVGCIRAK